MLCFGGTPAYSWSYAGGGISMIPGSGDDSETISPSEGGKSTITVTADLGDGRTLTRELDVYILEAMISGADVPSVATDPVVITDAATDSTVLTASLRETGSDLAGLSGVEYAWEVQDMLVASASPAGTASTTISPAAAGSTTVKATISYKGVSVEASRSLVVAGLSITGDEVMVKGATGKSLSASVTGFVGTPTVSSWNWGSGSGTVASLTGTDTSSVGVNPLAGGKSTVTVSAVVGGRTLTKSVDVYVLDIELGGTGLPASAADPVVLTTSATGSADLTASLPGLSGLDGVDWEWTSGDEDVFTVSPGNTAAATLSPVAAGSNTVTVKATYEGVEVTASHAVSVAGIVFTTFPKSIAMGGATSSCSLAAEVQGFSGTVSWGTWTSGTAAVATVTGQTDSGTSSSVTLNALRGGKTKITVTATAGGVTLSAEKDICVLQLSLACGDSLFTPPSGLTDTSYKLTLIKGDPVATSITADLVGLPAADVSYTWTPATSTKMDMTTSGTGNKTVRLAPAAAGNETVSVQATYDGESITQSVDVSVVGIRLTGSSTHEFNSDPTGPATANQITLSATLENIELAALTSSGIGFSLNDMSIATLTAEPATSTGRDVAVTALKGGKVTVTVTAALGSTGKVFSAKKDITIINILVTDGSGSPVPATGSISLADGSVTLSAELEGLEGGDFAWTCTPATGSDISINSTSGQTTSVSGSLGTASVTLTVTYGGGDYTKTIDFDVTYSCTVAGLGAKLDAISGTSATLPAKINVTGLTTGNWTDINTALEDCRSVYVDLSTTALPDGITSMVVSFFERENLVVPPEIPASVTNMRSCFADCRNLTTAPEIPASVTDMHECFYGCTSLTAAPAIPASVRDMNRCFQNCTSLTTAPEIPADVTDMHSYFIGCTSLSGTVTINASITDASKWENAFKNVSGVTVQVPDACTKAAIESASGNSGVTVVIAPGGSTTCP